MLTIAIQYPSFGPQHPPRLEAIVRECPYPDARVVAMEMFRKDSDYEWAPVTAAPRGFERYTVVDDESARARGRRRALRRAVRRALDDIQPDVLVVNGWGHRESRRSLDWCRERRRPVVMLSDSVHENTRRYWWKERYKRWLMRGIPAGFAAGAPQARYLQRLGLPAHAIFHPGSCVVDNAFWAASAADARRRADELRRSHGLPERYFLCVARFIALKNIPFLVQAYARYRADAGASPLGLVLCGSGPEEHRIREVARAEGVDDVVFAGFRQVDELPIYYGLASCFVLPSSVFEAWGLVVNEALASGLPALVSTQVGCAEDLVQDGVNGYRFDPFDVDALAARMRSVGRDEALRARMGSASREIVAHHSLEVGATNLWSAVGVALGAEG